MIDYGLLLMILIPVYAFFVLNAWTLSRGFWLWGWIWEFTPWAK